MVIESWNAMAVGSNHDLFTSLRQRHPDASVYFPFVPTGIPDLTAKTLATGYNCLKGLCLLWAISHAPGAKSY